MTQSSFARISPPEADIPGDGVVPIGTRGIAAAAQGPRGLTPLTRDQADRIAALAHQYHKALLQYLYRRYRNREQANDIAQELYLYVSRNPEKLPCIRNPLGWMITVASRLAAKDFRSGIRRRTVHLEASRCEVPGSTQYTEADLAERLDLVVDLLPSQLKRAVELRLNHQATVRSIASDLGVSVGTVCNLLGQFVAMFRAALTLDGLGARPGAGRPPNLHPSGKM